MITKGQTIELIRADPDRGPFGVWESTRGKVDEVDNGLSLFRVEWDNDTISIEAMEDQDQVWKIVPDTD